MASILHYLGCINNNPTNYCRISVPAINALPVTSLLMQSCRRHRSTAQLPLWGLLSCATSSIPCLPFLLSKNSFPCPLGMFETAAGFVSYIQVLQNQHGYIQLQCYPHPAHQKMSPFFGVGGVRWATFLTRKAPPEFGGAGHPIGPEFWASNRPPQKVVDKHSYERVSLRVHDRP